jgi:hypothetical protein
VAFMNCFSGPGIPGNANCDLSARNADATRALDSQPAHFAPPFPRCDRGSLRAPRLQSVWVGP